MRPDIYTKAVLTVIAIMLTVIACKPLVNPDITASAQAAPFAGVQFSSDGYNPVFCDPRTGEIWHYTGTNSGELSGKLWDKLRLAKLGQPLAIEMRDGKVVARP